MRGLWGFKALKIAERLASRSPEILRNLVWDCRLTGLCWGWVGRLLGTWAQKISSSSLCAWVLGDWRGAGFCQCRYSNPAEKLLNACFKSPYKKSLPPRNRLGQNEKLRFQTLLNAGMGGRKFPPPPRKPSTPSHNTPKLSTTARRPHTKAL